MTSKLIISILCVLESSRDFPPPRSSSPTTHATLTLPVTRKIQPPFLSENEGRIPISRTTDNFQTFNSDNTTPTFQRVKSMPILHNYVCSVHVFVSVLTMHKNIIV